MGAEKPTQAVRAALIEQGWRPGRPVIVISDGEPALPDLVCAATGGPVSYILDWWHISMRVRHLEQVLATLGFQPASRGIGPRQGYPYRRVSGQGWRIVDKATI